MNIIPIACKLTCYFSFKLLIKVRFVATINYACAFFVAGGAEVTEGVEYIAYNTRTLSCGR